MCLRDLREGLKQASKDASEKRDTGLGPSQQPQQLELNDSQLAPLPSITLSVSPRHSIQWGSHGVAVQPSNPRGLPLPRATSMPYVTSPSAAADCTARRSQAPMHRPSASGQQDLELLQLHKTKGLAGPVLVQAMSHAFAHAHCNTDTTAGTRAEGLCQQCNLLLTCFTMQLSSCMHCTVHPGLHAAMQTYPVCTVAGDVRFS